MCIGHNSSGEVAETGTTNIAETYNITAESRNEHKTKEKFESGKICCAVALQKILLLISQSITSHTRKLKFSGTNDSPPTKS